MGCIRGFVECSFRGLHIWNRLGGIYVYYRDHQGGGGPLDIQGPGLEFRDLRLQPEYCKSREVLGLSTLAGVRI